MSSSIFKISLRRALRPRSVYTEQVRHASLIRRPYRPYTFTQLVSLTDGSTFTVRTTSPAPVFRSTKDSRNHPLWQPSSSSLQNVEHDEAGRLRAFRAKFGRGWDAEENPDVRAERGILQEEMDESLMDLISGSANENGKMTEGTKETVVEDGNSGEMLVMARNASGKQTQVKAKDLEQFRKDQKLSRGWGA